MIPSLDWCRDIDYGTLPQWLTFGLGVVVGGFTIGGIITARRSYSKGVNDTHVAQARLCYAAVVKSGELHPSQPWDVVGDEPYESQYALTQGQFEEVEYTDDDGRVHVQSVQTSTISFVRFKVRNNSDEVISRVTVEILRTDGSRSGASFDIGVVDPESHRECVLFVDTLDRASLGALLSFEDSAGVKWERVNAEPVREVLNQSEGRVRRAWTELRKPTEP